LITTQPVRSAFELGWNARLPAYQEYLLIGRSWSGNTFGYHFDGIAGHPVITA
jgi:hypothetical protein